MSLSFYLSAGFAGQYVVYFPALARRLGSASAAILLARLIFLQTKPFEGEEAPSRRDFAGRWVSLPLAQAAWEAGLGDDELKAARRRLEAAGLIQTDYRRLQHEMRWQVDFDALDALGDDLSSCFYSKVEKPLSGKWENHFGESGNSLVDNVNNVFIKAVEAAAPAAAFNIKSTSHPKTASALASLAVTNHLAKPDSVLAKTEQSMRRALAAAKGLEDQQAASIVDALAEEGGWVSSAAARLANAAKQIGAGQAPLAVKAVAKQAAAVGLDLDPTRKRWAGQTVRLTDGSTAVVGPAGTVKVAGKLILAGELAKMLDDGRLKLVEGEPHHPPPQGGGSASAQPTVTMTAHSSPFLLCPTKGKVTTTGGGEPPQTPPTERHNAFRSCGKHHTPRSPVGCTSAAHRAVAPCCARLRGASLPAAPSAAQVRQPS